MWKNLRQPGILFGLAHYLWQPQMVVYQTAIMKSAHIKETLVIQLGPTAYYLRNRNELLSVKGFSWDPPVSTPRPTVVINVNESQELTVATFEQAFAHFKKNDDVFTDDFTTECALIIQRHAPSAFAGQKTDGSGPLMKQESEEGIEWDLKAWLSSRSCNMIRLSYSTPQLPLPEGPYFLLKHELRQAWRLYSDNLSAFVTATVPAENETGFQPLQVGAYSTLDRAIAVPSRLYYPRTDEKPLNGLRVAVKDNIHLQGVKTTLGSKSYTACYNPQEKTSVFVHQLIQKGAIIVGKTKLSAFAGSETPPEKCIDYFASWNIRADGYQGPSGSSMGAGASVAGYSWLDYGICTDTTGSMRMPASAHGVWALRVSNRALSMEGIVPSVPMFDTIGLMARNPESLELLLQASTMPKKTKLCQPLELLYPTDWFPMSNFSQQRMYDDFVEAIETTLGIKRTRISMLDLWSQTAPKELGSISLKDYLAKSVYWVNSYDVYHSYDNFRADYINKFGHQPYVSPWHKARWDIGAKITKEQYQQGVHEIAVFRAWVKTHLMPVDPGVCPKLMILPLGRPGANYRDVVPPQSGGGIISGYDEDFFTSMLGLPQIVVPIGQNPFESKITQRTEYVPIVATLTGAQGCEDILLGVAHSVLQKAGWPLEVRTGRLTFRVGDNNRNSVIENPESEAMS